MLANQSFVLIIFVEIEKKSAYYEYLLLHSRIIGLPSKFIEIHGLIN